MTIFFIIAALFVVLALAAIVPSALKNSDRAEHDQLEINIGIAKDRRDALNNALADGIIDQATHDTEQSDLENALALDLSAEQNKLNTPRSGVVVAICIALFIPIASGALYLHLGMPEGVNIEAAHQQAVAARNQANAEANGQPGALSDLLPNLEKKLEANPEDRDGWKLLGKSYLTIGEFANAKRALLRAYGLDANDPELLSQLAEATAMDAGGDLSGKPSEYLESALEIDPNHEQSLWLKAIASQQAGRHEEAIEQFNALKAGVADNPQAIASIEEMVAASQQALGIPVTPSSANTQNQTANAASADNADSNVADANSASSTTSEASLRVTVTLADNVLAQVKPSDSVFIFARASAGPPMPLAVSRHVVSELPVSVVLDDSMAMMPAMTLSQFPSVTVGARISQSGNAIAQPGDWFGEQTDVLPANVSQVELTIHKQK